MGLIKLLCKLVLRPIILVFKEEFGWGDEGSLRKKLDDMSKERLQLILDNKMYERLDNIETRLALVEKQMALNKEKFKYLDKADVDLAAYSAELAKHIVALRKMKYEQKSKSIAIPVDTMKEMTFGL
jgi:hypothetical protein